MKEKRSKSEREEGIDRFEDERVREGNVYTDRQQDIKRIKFGRGEEKER